VTRSGDATSSELLDRLRAGEPPPVVRAALSLNPAEWAAALGAAAWAMDDATDGPRLTQSPPSRPWLAPALGESACADLYPRSSRPLRLALAAGLLQIHDFWDASHEAAQKADDLGERGFSAYWHGIAHRREPDAGNAAYWFRRVGRHPLFTQLARDAIPLLEARGTRVTGALALDGDVWSPFAFIDLCMTVRPGSDLATLALKLQRLEMQALLDATLAAL
jgi:hypothetical protein